MPEYRNTAPAVASARGQNPNCRVIALLLGFPVLLQRLIHDHQRNFKEAGRALAPKVIGREGKAGSGPKSGGVAPPQRRVIYGLGPFHFLNQAIHGETKPVLPAPEAIEAKLAQTGKFAP